MADAQQTAAIEIDRVTKTFGTGQAAVLALDDVSVSVAENEFFTLLGPSGCGKTTLLRMIAGFDHPTRGAIRLRGADIAHLPPFQRPVNTVFQSYALFPHMSVARNIGFGLEMLGRPKAEVDREVARMLALVRMEALADRATADISGGQQQRVALARALAPKPSVLLLDEPLSALDYKLRKEMQIELKRLQSETGITFIFVTHDQEEALTMSDRIAVMSGGRILQVGSPREIYDHPRVRFVADFIGDTNFLTATVLAQHDGRATLRLTAGAEIEAAVPTGVATSGTVTAAVRPEHAQLAAAGQGLFDATVQHVVYIGTDTQVHLSLDDGTPFVVRLQNRRDDAAPARAGDRVGLSVEGLAAQLLGD